MHKQCSHCTAFMPTWKELAVSLADKHVRVVILDQRSNDVPKWFGAQPPMLLLVKKGQKQTDRPIMYTPGQQPTVEGMIEWLQSQGVDLPSSSKVTAGSGSAPSTGDTGKETSQKPRQSSKKKSSKKGGKGGDKDEL